MFGQWQPRYAEAGIPTFPVAGQNKKPAVSNFLKAGLPASRQWAAKFADANAFGFACGPRTGLTILDIDEASEKLLADALAICGDTPVIARTHSGKFHAYYAHGGEPRQIRPDKSRPIDVLGARGFAVAPPSLGDKGDYEFIQGSLADLRSLPRMLPLVGTTELAPPVPANDVVPVGERNQGLYKACMMHVRSCGTFDELAGYAASFNQSFADPLPGEEVMRTAVSAWAKEQAGENWFGTGGRVVLQHGDIDRLLPLGTDAVALILQLRRHHWGRDFHVANAMAGSMPDGKWTPKRFAAARKRLLDAGELVEVRSASMKHGPAVYRFP